MLRLCNGLTQCLFIRVGQLQIVSRAAAMRIMTIHAAHLGFANRVVVRKVSLGILLGVTPQAVLILLPARLDRSLLAADLAIGGGYTYLQTICGWT